MLLVPWNARPQNVKCHIHKLTHYTYFFLPCKSILKLEVPHTQLPFTVPPSPSHTDTGAFLHYGNEG